MPTIMGAAIDVADDGAAGGATVMRRLMMGGRMLTTRIRVLALVLVASLSGMSVAAERAAKTFHIVLEVVLPPGTPVPTAQSTIEFTVGPRIDDPDLWHPFRNVRDFKPVVLRNVAGHTPPDRAAQSMRLDFVADNAVPAEFLPRQMPAGVTFNAVPHLFTHGARTGQPDLTNCADLTVRRLKDQAGEHGHFRIDGVLATKARITPTLVRKLDPH